MSPLPPGGSLPSGGSLPPAPPRTPDWVNDREELLGRLVRAVESQRQVTEDNFDLREELRQAREERTHAQEQVLALTTIVNNLQGRVQAIAAQAQRATNTANEAWMGTAALAVLTVVLPLVNPAYQGACWAAKGVKAMASSAKATLASYGVPIVFVARPLALGAAT
jgi:hypothetical protein